MNISKYIEETKAATGRHVVKRIVCKDGFTMSVQASEGHYCTPRTDGGPWHAVEVGFPSQAEESLMPFAEEEDRPTDTVYGYVPVVIVEQIIEAHGGQA